MRLQISINQGALAYAFSLRWKGINRLNDKGRFI